MFEREFHQHVADAMHEIAKEIEKDLPEEVVKDLHEMAFIQAGITKRLHTNRAIEFKKIQRYNELCYKHFGKMQDGGEFEKEEADPIQCFDFGEAIRRVKRGERVTRKGWNGKDQFIVLGTVFSVTLKYGTGIVPAHEDIGNEAIVFFGTRGQQIGWLASQADMLAEDWCAAK